MTMNWRDLNVALPDMREEEVQTLLYDEMAGLRRKTVVIRLHQRYTALRAVREREALLAELNAAPPAP